MEVWSIINITPDSFFAGSRAQSEAEIVQAVTLAVEQGADRLDIGAMSTRPGHEEVSESEELRRLDTAVNIIRRQLPEMPLSIDTFRSSVVKSLHHNFGQFTVNDVQGGTKDREMFDTVGRLGLPYVMMSNDPTIGTMHTFFAEMLPRAEASGIKEIIIDPGFGFGKDTVANYKILHQMTELKRHDRQILVGLSRKSMIYLTLQTTADHASHGTTALHWAALAQGATILRAHDTLSAKQTIKLYETFANSIADSRC